MFAEGSTLVIFIKSVYISTLPINAGIILYPVENFTILFVHNSWPVK